eukprot:1159680-Pelagomonas_calceolata.AAC.9
MDDSFSEVMLTSTAPPSSPALKPSALAPFTLPLTERARSHATLLSQPPPIPTPWPASNTWI